MAFRHALDRWVGSGMAVLVTRTVIALVAVLGAGNAAAYMLPTTTLLRMAIDARRDQKVDDLTVDLTTEYADTGEHVDERVYMKVPWRLRRIEETSTGRTYIEKNGQRAAGEGNATTRLTGPTTDLLATFLAPERGDLDTALKVLVQRLRDLGVQTDVVSLARFEGKPAYVIGARVWESDQPQVWLDKATLFFVRSILPIERDSERYFVDTQYKEYGSPLTGNAFPRVIEKYRAGKLLRSSEVTSLQLNQKLPDALFQLP